MSHLFRGGNKVQTLEMKIVAGRTVDVYPRVIRTAKRV